VSIKGRIILESAVAAHELIHAAHSRGESALVLKLDYEKAYDRVDWTFLEEMLESRGFGIKIHGLIMSLLINGSSCVRINDMNDSYFKSGKGLKQGDLASPILFNLVADVFLNVIQSCC
jgi:hypothetical protein